MAGKQTREVLALIDNVDAPLGSAVINAALTCIIWSDRLLGTNEQIKLRLLMAFFATGNEVKIVGDTNRRYLAIQLYSEGEQPDRRSDFRYPHLLQWVRENRSRLLVSALTILASYLKAGKPSLASDSWGSYEAWSAVIRNAVIFSGLADPCDKRDALEEAEAPDQAIVFQTLLDWQSAEKWYGKSLTVRQVMDLSEGDEVAVTLRQTLARLCGIHDLKQLGARQIGNRFKSVRDRDFNGLMLCQVGHKREGGVRWTIVDNYRSPS